MRVTWDDGAWIVASRDVDLPVAAEVPSPGRALTWARLDRPRGELPAGEYALRRSKGAFEVTAGGREAVEQLDHIARESPPVPLLMAELGWASGQGVGRSLALLPGFESLAGLPGAVAVHRGDERWRLPGERILKLVGDGPPTKLVAGWTAVAFENRALGQAPAIVGFLEGLQAGPSARAVWIDPQAARQLAEQTARALDAVPIVGEREARRWWALTVVLEPFSRGGRLAAVVAEKPTAAVLRLAVDIRAPVPLVAD